MLKIDPTRSYTIQEIVDNEFIPIVKKYSGIYSLLTNVIKSESTPKRKFELVKETTKYKIKAVDSKVPWSVNSSIRVEGSDIIKFLQLNNLI